VLKNKTCLKKFAFNAEGPLVGERNGNVVGKKLSIVVRHAKKSHLNLKMAF
jgi:hypothetical protein